MDAPANGRRRMQLLKLLARSAAPSSTAKLSKSLGWCLATTRGHLHALVAQGWVKRVNFRQWALADGVDIRRTNANAIG